MSDPRQHMPPPAPLDLRIQDLHAAIHAETRAAREAHYRSPWTWRVLVFGATFAGTALLLTLLRGFFAQNGMDPLEVVLLVIIGGTFAWIALNVASVAAAILRRVGRGEPARPRKAGDPLHTALLVPIYNESPQDVFGNAAAMLADLSRLKSDNRFSLFILSDTRGDDIAAQEWRAFQWLQSVAPSGVQVHYRRRPDNVDKKTGNLAQWIRGWGAAYDAMLVLDADSLMSGRAIMDLTNALRSDPQAGLIQSFPSLIGAESFFGRVQQFSSATYGWLLAEGLSLWTQNEANYWGHNAIMRTRAFAESAGLPYLTTWRGQQQMILSHDFVEAGLLRRAGWAVRFLPVRGSFEETPATLVDYIIRDRRWCQGNMQHLRLLATRGFHPISRLHLFFGALGYLMSPAWLFLLVVWSALGLTEMVPEGYFSERNPLYPLWPQMNTTQAVSFLLFMYGILLLPKLAATAMIAAAPRVRRRFGGGRALAGGVALEIVASVLYAPIMMVQQSLAVARILIGRPVSWAPQRREARRIPVAALLRFHWIETVLGLLLVAGLWGGVVSLWLLPIAFSLALAVPLSMLSACDISRVRLRFGRLETPQSLFVPPIWARAQEARAEVQRQLEDTGSVAAE
jgi:membrane glycosyltransferase